jgi:hypothetical protein
VVTVKFGESGVFTTGAGGAVFSKKVSPHTQSGALLKMYSTSAVSMWHPFLYFLVL